MHIGAGGRGLFLQFGDEIGEIRAPEAGLILWRINHGMAGEGEKVFGLGVPRDEGQG